MKKPFSLLFLAAFALSAQSARAVHVSYPTFNPVTPTYGPDSGGNYGSPSSSLIGTALPTGSNNVTGVTYANPYLDGEPVPLVFSQTASGSSTGTLTAFNISGTGNSGSISSTSSEFSGVYHFILADTATLPNTLTISNWTLNYSITASGLTDTGSASGMGTGDFSGTVQFPIRGTSFTAYSASLTVNYLVTGSGTSISVTVPTDPFDLDLAPEPGTWTMVAVGIAGAGIWWMRARRRRAA